MDRRRKSRVNVPLSVRVWGVDAHSVPFTHLGRLRNVSEGGAVLTGDSPNGAGGRGTRRSVWRGKDANARDLGGQTRTAQIRGRSACSSYRRRRRFGGWISIIAVEWLAGHNDLETGVTSHGVTSLWLTWRKEGGFGRPSFLDLMFACNAICERRAAPGRARKHSEILQFRSESRFPCM